MGKVAKSLNMHRAWHVFVVEKLHVEEGVFSNV
jgi:hypothetical protein